jgi:hypothetical protein
MIQSHLSGPTTINWLLYRIPKIVLPPYWSILIRQRVMIDALLEARDHERSRKAASKKKLPAFRKFFRRGLDRSFA